MNFINRFMIRSPGLTDDTPAPVDASKLSGAALNWLFLMQHHGAPTRLLDWSASVLVALYFAVRDSRDHSYDGEIVALEPTGLNKESEVNGFPLLTNPKLRYFANEAWLKQPETTAKKLGLTEPPSKPLAIEPILSFPRISSQQSVFTIHPTPRPPVTLEIPNLIGDKSLIRYRIPRSSQCRLLAELNALGVHEQSLFVTLEALASTIVYDPQFRCAACKDEKK